jgi:hypothetical protein
MPGQHADAAPPPQAHLERAGPASSLLRWAMFMLIGCAAGFTAFVLKQNIEWLITTRVKTQSAHTHALRRRRLAHECGT